MPESSVTSTSTVGFPRESRICRPRTLVMVLTRHSSASLYGPLRRIAQGESEGGAHRRPWGERLPGYRRDTQEKTVDLGHLDPLASRDRATVDGRFPER